MWEKSPSKMSEVEINDKYESGEKRILTEINREKLPSFVEALLKNIERAIQEGEETETVSREAIFKIL